MLHLKGEANIIKANLDDYERIHIDFSGDLMRKIRQLNDKTQYDVFALGTVDGFFNIAVRPGNFQQDFTNIGD